MDNFKAIFQIPKRLRFNNIPGLFVKKTIEDTVDRDCGYQLPWNPLHASCVGYTVCAILVHFGLISVNFDRIGEAVSVKLLSIQFTIVIVSALCVSLIDPRHYLLRYRIPLHTQIDIEPARYLCHKCNLLRERDEVKHCHHCGKCVDGFDHHCFALNHCVGRRNYWIMMVLFNNGLFLTAALLLAAFVFIYGVAARSHIMQPQYAHSEAPFTSAMLLCFGKPCKAMLPLIVVIIYTVPTVIVMVSFGALVWAHWNLIAENSSTWQHFKQRRQSPEKGESLIMKCLMGNFFSIFARKKKQKAVQPTPSTTDDEQSHRQNEPSTVSKENLLENMEQQQR